MEDFVKLQYFSIFSKVVKELERNIGLGSKDLAEFIVELAKDADSEEQYLKSLEENGAEELSFQFSRNIYHLIRRMIPDQDEEISKGLGQNGTKLGI